MYITLKTYPSGYAVPVRAAEDGNYLTTVDNTFHKEGDKELNELMKRIATVRLTNISSSDKLKLVDCAKRLFGDMDAFITHNLTKNPRVQGMNLDFIIDTVDFINGGVRSLSIMTWTNCLDQTPKKNTLGLDDRSFSFSKVGSNYIAKWLRQPNGFSDLAATLILIFGLREVDPSNTVNSLI